MGLRHASMWYDLGNLPGGSAVFADPVGHDHVSAACVAPAPPEPPAPPGMRRLNLPVFTPARHVPAGIYARRALQSLGLWDATEPRTARMPDVRQALALVERGEAILGIVYERTGDRPFARIEDVVTPEELRAVTAKYKQVAGYAPEQLRRH